MAGLSEEERRQVELRRDQARGVEGEWSGWPVVLGAFGMFFFPKQFTAGVLDSILSMSTLFRLPCLPSQDLLALNSLQLSPSWGGHVRPIRISVFSILYICLPAWVVMFPRAAPQFKKKSTGSTSNIDIVCLHLFGVYFGIILVLGAFGFGVDGLGSFGGFEVV